MNYLQRLTLRLATGLEQMPAERRDAHASFLAAAQRADGGFAGREGPSDLYYTGFALRGLALLGQLDGELARSAADYLQAKLAGRVPMVDFLSLIYSAMLLELAAGINVFATSSPDWRTSVATALETFRRPDGGYAKTEEGQSSSMYHTFLVVLSQQAISVPIVDPDRIGNFVLSRRQNDGGFVEMAVMKRSGTNPTAAAIGLMQVLERASEVREGAVDFLAEMQTDDGGLRANTRIPVADLLSTFTGLLSLADLSALHEIDCRAVRQFVHRVEHEEGGFHGAEWDSGCDVEYTFYGLGALALLHEHEAST